MANSGFWLMVSPKIGRVLQVTNYVVKWSSYRIIHIDRVPKFPSRPSWRDQLEHAQTPQGVLPSDMLVQWKLEILKPKWLKWLVR